VAARNALEARGLRDIEVDELDLSELTSVRRFAERFLAIGRSVDILINNAAIMASPEARVGDGWESQFATNHLGHCVLVLALAVASTTDRASMTAARYARML
jgi:NAD(P)-dependent dehydrogenase (short-subunit alcohol dehydrogenase family)